MEAQSLQRYIAKKLPDAEIPLTPVVVFSNPNVELDVSDTSVPALHIKKLKDWLRAPGKGQGLALAARNQVQKLFETGD